MWDVKGTDISMAEGDWGVVLPITLTGTTALTGDTMTMTVKSAINETALLTKSLTFIGDSTFHLTLSSADTALLPVGHYVYSLDWAHPGTFACCLVPAGGLTVEERA